MMNIDCVVVGSRLASSNQRSQHLFLQNLFDIRRLTLPLLQPLISTALSSFPLWGEWPSGLRLCYQNRKVPVQTPLGARPGLGTQPHHETPGDLRVEFVKRSD